MSLITYLIVGLLAGIIAKAVMPGTRDEPSGWAMTLVLGIAGAFVGGFIASALGLTAVSGGLIWSVLMAAMGSIVIIGLLRLFTGGRRAV